MTGFDRYAVSFECYCNFDFPSHCCPLHPPFLILPSKYARLATAIGLCCFDKSWNNEPAKRYLCLPESQQVSLRYQARQLAMETTGSKPATNKAIKAQRQ
jgi:hypothetical protein